MTRTSKLIEGVRQKKDGDKGKGLEPMSNDVTRLMKLDQKITASCGRGEG